MTMTPPWLYYLCGVMALVVAAYCLVSVVAKAVSHRPLGWDIDISHTLMGVTMSGTAVTRWAFGPPGVWEAVFAILAAWFLARTVALIFRHGPHVPHFLVHAVMGVAMALMYRFPMQPVSRSSMGSMAMTASRLDPGVAVVITVILCTSAVFTLDAATRGRSHHAPRYRLLVSAPPGAQVSPADLERDSSHRGGDAVRAPWPEDASHVVLCVIMGFLLLLMI